MVSVFGTFGKDGVLYGENIQSWETDPCDDLGRFQSLTLVANLQLGQLNVHIPPEIELLTDLTIMNLPYNDIGGSFKAFLPFNSTYPE